MALEVLKQEKLSHSAYPTAQEVSDRDDAEEAVIALADAWVELSKVHNTHFSHMLSGARSTINEPKMRNCSTIEKQEAQAYTKYQHGNWSQSSN